MSMQKFEQTVTLTLLNIDFQDRGSQVFHLYFCVPVEQMVPR